MVKWDLNPGPPASFGFSLVTHPALLFIFISHLCQPLFLQKEFSAAGIKVTKLEKEKNIVSTFPKCPSRTFNPPKVPVSGVHPEYGLLSMKGM